MGKRFTTTGKKVFRDNQENIFYVELNSGTRITVENNPETMATIAWSQASLQERFTFIYNQTKGFDPSILEDMQYDLLPPEVKRILIDYQKSKMEIKA